MISPADKQRIQGIKARLKQVSDNRHVTYAGPAGSRLGEGVSETLDMLLDIKNQLDRIERMLAAAPKKKATKK